MTNFKKVHITFALNVMQQVINNSDDPIASLAAMSNLMKKKRGGPNVPTKAKKACAYMIDRYLKEAGCIVEETA